MVDYNEYTVEQLSEMVSQEAVMATKIMTEGKIAPVERMARVADLMETIGNRYIDYAEDFRKGNIREFY